MRGATYRLKLDTRASAIGVIPSFGAMTLRGLDEVAAGPLLAFQNSNSGDHGNRAGTRPSIKLVLCAAVLAVG